LDEIIEMVSRSENLEDEFGINKTIGILLHGPHGTGKSTIARYLALTLGRVLILTTSDNLMNAMDYVQNHSSRKFILLIEDIDFMFTDRRKKKPTRAKKTEENEEASTDDDMNKRTSLLFQVLDGVLSNSNLIVIATTNYFDRLDPALVRDGRFDYKIELKGLDYETAAKVCERFAVTPEEIDLSSWKLPIAPATLQTVLLRYKVTNKNTYDPEKLTDNGEEN
jgi:chaperone BCS1